MINATPAIAGVASSSLGTLNDIHHDICGFFHADGAGIQAYIVVRGSTPGAAGVVLIVDGTALILFLKTGSGTLFGFTVKPDDPVCTEVHIRMDVYMERIGTVFQNIVCIAANDDTGTFFRQL